MRVLQGRHRLFPIHSLMKGALHVMQTRIALDFDVVPCALYFVMLPDFTRPGFDVVQFLGSATPATLKRAACAISATSERPRTAAIAAMELPASAIFSTVSFSGAAHLSRRTVATDRPQPLRLTLVCVAFASEPCGNEGVELGGAFDPEYFSAVLGRHFAFRHPLSDVARAEPDRHIVDH